MYQLKKDELNTNIIILSLSAALAMLLPSCEIDDRIDDLTV